MKDLLLLLLYLLTTIAKLLRPGGTKAVVAENLLMKQQWHSHCRGLLQTPMAA